MAKTYRGILIFVVILGIVMGLAGKKFDGYVYTNTEPRSNTECTLTQRVFDDADVLTDEEEAKLEKLIAEKEKLIGKITAIEPLKISRSLSDRVDYLPIKLSCFGIISVSVRQFSPVSFLP